MRNPYKKFQNSSIHGSKVMLCIKKRDEWTDGPMDGRTKDGQMNNPEAICPSNFFEVGVIIRDQGANMLTVTDQPNMDSLESLSDVIGLSASESYCKHSSLVIMDSRPMNDHEANMLIKIILSNFAHCSFLSSKF